MLVNKFSQFLIESTMYELIKESQIVYNKDFIDILIAIRDEKDNNDACYIAGLLLRICGREIDILQNHIDVTNNPQLVSFIPDNKLSYDSVMVNYSYEFYGQFNKDVLSKLDIPFEGIIDTDDSDIENNYKLIKTYNTNDYDIDIKDHVMYYLQNNVETDKYIILYKRIQSTGMAIIPINDNITRSEVKIGRFVKKILDAFLKNNKSISVTPSEIEKFINTYMSAIVFENDAFNNFEIVSGNEIRRWYDEKSYINDKGQLGNSCMKYNRCSEYFGIYCDNPDVCKLLIFKDNNNKLLGRALLWELMDGTKYMDRIYTSKDSHIKLFNKYADKNGYFYNKSIKNRLDKQISVKLKPIKYNKYPFMDTLTYYLPEKGILTNKNNFKIFSNIPIKSSLINKVNPFKKGLIMNNLNGIHGNFYTTFINKEEY